MPTCIIKYMRNLTVEEAELELAALGFTLAERDFIVHRGLVAGVSKARVSRLTGIARSTVDRIEKSARNHAKSES